MLMLLQSLFLLAALSVVAAGDDTNWLVEFDVQLAPGLSDTLTLEVHPEWAPIGAARFLELVTMEDSETFWQGLRFARLHGGFVATFDMPGNNVMAPDPISEPNQRGYVSFATSVDHSPTTQMLINFRDNQNFDDKGFAPFAKIVGGMEEVIDHIHSGASSRELPDQSMIEEEGDEFVKKGFVTAVRLVEDKEL